MAGRTALVKDLKDRFDCADKVTFNLDEVDVNSVASLLKTYLRELPDSIIPAGFYQRFMNVALQFQDSRDQQGKQAAAKEARAAMKELPKDNLIVLAYLCEFLSDVSEKSNLNKMTRVNLATVFGPNLIRNVTEVNTPELMMATADLTQQLALMLITHHADIFASDPVELIINVPEGNLLDLTNDIETPVITPIRPGLLDDLKGIDFIDGSQPSDAMLLGSPSESYSPGSPNGSFHSENGDVKMRPIVPKRRSKIQRGRRVSERAKNDATSPPMSPSMYIASLGLGGGDSIDKDTPDDGSEDIIAKLQAEIKMLREREIETEEKHDKQISELKSSHNDIVVKLRTRYDVMKTIHDKQVASLQNSHRKELKMEKSGRVDAVNRIVGLQTKLQQYQNKYGQLV